MKHKNNKTTIASENTIDQTSYFLGKKFWYEVSIKVVSGVLLSIILVLLGYTLFSIFEKWFESDIVINAINEKNFGTDRDQGLIVHCSTNDSTRFIITGKVGDYFIKKQSDYEIGIVVEDSDGFLYLQNNISKINKNGYWEIKKIILKDEGKDYRLFAIVVKSINELIVKSPKIMNTVAWRDEKEFSKVKSLIYARSDKYKARWIVKN
jgi:hypothetical protein